MGINGKEVVLLTSDDNTITLTNYRIIYKTAEITKEMLLKDLLSHEIINKRQDIFLGLTIVTGIAGYFFIKNERENNYSGGINLSVPPAFYILILLLTIFLVCYFNFIKKELKISGRYSSIEFSVRNLSTNSLNKFVE